MGDELGSSDPDASEDEKLLKYKKFMKEHLGKDCEFKLGMEFDSLSDFKDVIIEWSVLNRREITFVKNKRDKVRVERKGKCRFLGLCSKVGGSMTFQIKKGS